MQSRMQSPTAVLLPHQAQLMGFAGWKLDRDDVHHPQARRGMSNEDCSTRGTWPERFVWGISLQPLTVSISLRFLLRLPWLCWFCRASLQLFQLLHEQSQVLQQVPVLEQQLVDAGLSLHAGSGLCCHLIFQQMHLQWEQRARCVWARCVNSSDLIFMLNLNALHITMFTEFFFQSHASHLSLRSVFVYITFSTSIILNLKLKVKTENFWFIINRKSFLIRYCNQLNQMWNAKQICCISTDNAVKWRFEYLLTCFVMNFSAFVQCRFLLMLRFTVKQHYCDVAAT